MGLRIKLEVLDWHDLSLDNLSISRDSIRIDVSAIVGERETYRQFCLELFHFTDCLIDISSNFSSSVLKDVEVAKFDYKEAKGLLSGTLGILPGNTGYWSIVFKNAKWRFNEHTG